MYAEWHHLQRQCFYVIFKQKYPCPFFERWPGDDRREASVSSPSVPSSLVGYDGVQSLPREAANANCNCRSSSLTDFGSGASNEGRVAMVRVPVKEVCFNSWLFFLLLSSLWFAPMVRLPNCDTTCMIFVEGKRTTEVKEKEKCYCFFRVIFYETQCVLREVNENPCCCRSFCHVVPRLLFSENTSNCSTSELVAAAYDCTV